MQSLVHDHAPEKLGYLTALSVEPVFECLAPNGLLTSNQKKEWGTLFTITQEEMRDGKRVEFPE